MKDLKFACSCTCALLLVIILVPIQLVGQPPLQERVPRDDEAVNVPPKMSVLVLGLDGQPVADAQVQASVWTREEFQSNRDYVTNAQGCALVELPKTLQILRLWARKSGHPPLFAQWWKERQRLAFPDLTQRALAATLIIASAVWCEPVRAIQTESHARPNIVLIIADDMNWDDCGAYGHPTIRTPNIDRLAAEGMRFQHAYLTASSCSPSRASIITGKYPHNTGAEQLHWPLPPGTITFVQQLKEAGYFTAAVGKWHLGEAVKEHFHVVREASTAGFQLPSGDGQAAPRMVAPQPSGCEEWIAALKARPKDKPCFFWLAALDPHREYEEGTLEPPHRLRDVKVPKHLPDIPQVRGDLRLYYDEIGRLDQYVGRVVDELDRQGASENTALFFISDNGRPFPRDKTTLYDGGIRTPWIVRWPARVGAGLVSSSLVSSIDLAPTLSELAGLPPRTSYEGKSICAILANPSAVVRDYVFAEDHWHDFEDHARSVGNQRYKLIRNDYPDLPATPSADALRSPTWQVMRSLDELSQLTEAQRSCFRCPRPVDELYDLQRDPGELLNVIERASYRGVRDELRAELNRWSQRTGDYLPEKRTPDEFDRVTGEPDHTVRVRPRPSKRAMFGTYGEY